MGLTLSSTGKNAVDNGLEIHKERQDDRIIALAGNPNVGKSTVFNELTGLNQHTGNWPGKTVSNAQGRCEHADRGYVLVDLPGTYSLLAHSAEEEVARDFICFGGSDAVVVVCDATCLERNLNLVLQTMEITPNTIVCLNLMDEAEKKHIRVNITALEKFLGVPVVAASARSGMGLHQLMDQVEEVCSGKYPCAPRSIVYPKVLESAVALVSEELRSLIGERISSRWLALRLLEGNTAAMEGADRLLGFPLSQNPAVQAAVQKGRELMHRQGMEPARLGDSVTLAMVKAAEEAASQSVTFEDPLCNRRDRRLDKLLTSKGTGIPIMLLLLSFIFWLTISGANIPSQMLADVLFQFQDQLTEWFMQWGSPQWLHGALVLGVYRVAAWVVSVMLPPMAIFFPLFTLLEDLGYLPRVAFNLDHHFKKACACGKQSLTMCMGFGCNAAGIVGCRIIDSPRERLIAIITNNFVPCNGRFPTIIALITMFFVGSAPAMAQSALSAVMLTGVILLGVVLTFMISRLLSHTILKGVPSSFTLELPPYRRPQIGKVLVRSIFDRTLFVLGRAVSVAAPAGLLIWVMANVSVGGQSLLAHSAAFLDPFGRLLGMDGVILLAFILGFPANEIVVPIMMMTYLATGTLSEASSLTELHGLFVANGWTWTTAISTILFCLMHWPCSTTCLTIAKETRSLKWTMVSMAVPTITGILICFLFTTVSRFMMAIFI